MKKRTKIFIVFCCVISMMLAATIFAFAQTESDKDFQRNLGNCARGGTLCGNAKGIACSDPSNCPNGGVCVNGENCPNGGVCIGFSDGTKQECQRQERHRSSEDCSNYENRGNGNCENRENRGSDNCQNRGNSNGSNHQRGSGTCRNNG